MLEANVSPCEKTLLSIIYSMKFAETIYSEERINSSGIRSASSDAFNAVYSSGISFVKSTNICGNCWGRTEADGFGGSIITIYSNANISSPDYNNFLVHELGHSFDIAVGLQLSNGYEERIFRMQNNGWTTMPRGNDGFVPRSSGVSWIQGNHDDGYIEESADMFLGWVYDTWASDISGIRRANWIELWMTPLLQDGGEVPLRMQNLIAMKTWEDVNMKKYFYVGVSYFFIFTLSNCISPRNSISNSTQESTSTAMSQTSTPTFISYPTKSPPPAPDGVPLTFTPLPAFSSEDAQKLVMNLYENNPCELPCWRGITPGQTDWREAWQFLERFATNQWPWDNLLLESQQLPGYMYFQVFLNIPKPEDEFDSFFLNHLVFVINIDTFNVDYIDVNTGNINDYTIPELLFKYGKPENIYVYVSDHPLPEFTGVTIFLYYPQHGFISNHFTTVNAEELRKPEFTACFQKVTNLYLWPKEQTLSFEERLEVSGTDAIGLKPIDTISGFNTEYFYQTYVNSQEENPCVDFNFIK